MRRPCCCRRPGWGVDTTAIARQIREVGPSVFYPMPVRAFDAAAFGTYDTRDEATIRGFRERAVFNYVQGVCPYATGSMSEKITEHEMLYLPDGVGARGVRDRDPPPRHRGRRGRRLGARVPQDALSRDDPQGVHHHPEPARLG